MVRCAVQCSGAGSLLCAILLHTTTSTIDYSTYCLTGQLCSLPTKLHGGTYMVSASNFHSQNVAMKPRITPYPANFVVPENGSVFLFFLRNFCYVTRFPLLLCFLLSNCHTDLIKVKQNARSESIFWPEIPRIISFSPFHS